MARVARKAPQIESRSLARISQGPHGREIAAVRGLRSRSALLRLDRQPGEATRRRSLCDQGDAAQTCQQMVGHQSPDRKSTRLNSSHTVISYAVFCLKKKKIIANLLEFAYTQ